MAQNDTAEKPIATAAKKAIKRRQYIGPSYKNGLILPIPALSNRPQDLKRWPSKKIEQMIQKYPGIARYFEDPE